mgnify:CR=1 FL=1
MNLPATVEELTPAWLTDALRAGGHLVNGARVAGVRSERLGEGVGFIGVVCRLSLTYRDGDGPTTVIAKLPSPEPGAREIGNLYGLYEREVHFYEDMGSATGLTAPRCYFSQWDAGEERSLLLLEDLAPYGRVGDQLAGCSAAEAALALSELAKLHATYWNSPRLDEIAWLPRGTDLVRSSMTQAYPDARDPFLARVGERLAPGVRACIPDLHEHLLALLDDVDREGTFTIGHGDYRLDNMFFGTPGGPYELAVFDWQSPNRAWGAYDLAYFISGTLEPAQRRASERDALRRYHEQLQAGGVRGYSFDQLVFDYRRSLMVYLGIFAVNGATLEQSNERAVRLFEVIFDRLNDAIVEHDAVATLPRA